MEKPMEQDNEEYEAEDRICETCRYYVPRFDVADKKTDFGICKKNAPTTKKGWCSVSVTDWCVEHKPRERSTTFDIQEAAFLQDEKNKDRSRVLASLAQERMVPEDVILPIKLRIMDLAVAVGEKEYESHYKKMCELVFGK